MKTRIYRISVAKSRRDASGRMMYSRFSKDWQPLCLQWDELCRLCFPIHTGESLAEYQALKRNNDRASKEKAANIKDVGAFVGGQLKGRERKMSEMVMRSLITLDFDYMEGENIDIFWNDVLREFPEMQVLVYSTHSYCDAAPRVRVVIGVDRDMTIEEYEAVARWCAKKLCIDRVDKCSYQPCHAMYFCSVPKDVMPFYNFTDGMPLAVDDVLSHYLDWRDPSAWPRSAIHEGKEAATPCRNGRGHGGYGGMRLKDPREKRGIHGAFCRAYSVSEAIRKFLSHIYEDEFNGRFSFKGATGASGLVIYDNDLYAYSNHASDPANNGHCLDAFELVMLHLFGEGKDAYKRMEGLL